MSDENAAALKVQKTFRGHQARNGQQEESRLQWMAYYMQPEIGEWEEALSLAVSPEEEEQIKQETKATIRCYPFDEQHRAAGQTCFMTGGPATHMALFARAF